MTAGDQMLVFFNVFGLSLVQSRLGPLMDILKEHIGHMESEQLNSHQSELTAFFLKALDFRSEHSEVSFHRVTVMSHVFHWQNNINLYHRIALTAVVKGHCESANRCCSSVEYFCDLGH